MQKEQNSIILDAFTQGMFKSKTRTSSFTVHSKPSTKTFEIKSSNASETIKQINRELEVCFNLLCNLN